MDKMSGKKTYAGSSAGKAGVSGSHQGGTVKTYLPDRPIKIVKGNASQST